MNDAFWNSQLKDRDNAFVINGEHYRTGKAYPQKGYGFNGEHYRIVTLAGQVIDTCDLWHQGTVPQEYKEVLPDNAKFARLIEVKQWNTCPNCKNTMNRETCFYTSCSNENFVKGESIKVHIR